MEQAPIQIIGIVREGIYRKRSIYTSRQDECNFQLESGENIWCKGFIPHIRKGWKVIVIGDWNPSKKYIYALNVERFIEKPKFKQLEIVEFAK